MRAISFVLIIGLFAVASCGDMRDAAQDVGDHVEGVADDISNWINEEPIKQREEKCRDEAGSWTPVVKVAACKEGRVEITLVDTQQNEVVHTQRCSTGSGYDFEFQCVHTNRAGDIYFNDGPSTPHLLQSASAVLDDTVDQMRWNDVFWMAAVNHDYCYHHNGTSRDFTKNDCDQQFFVDLTAVCTRDGNADKFSWFSEGSCKRQAALMYQAVSGAGDEAWDAMDSEVEYPSWTPLWQTFGMAEAPELQTLTDMLGGAVGLL